MITSLRFHDQKSIPSLVLSTGPVEGRHSGCPVGQCWAVDTQGPCLDVSLCWAGNGARLAPVELRAEQPAAGTRVCSVRVDLEERELVALPSSKQPFFTS